MPDRKFFINDPALAEFIFHAMHDASADDKRELSPQELIHFSKGRSLPESVMRRFADNETLDRRLLLLARLGYEYCLVVKQRDFNISGLLDEIVTQYNFVEKRHALTESMAKKKVFVMSSRDVVIGLHMAAQNSHSQVYVLNYNYVNLHKKLDEYRQQKIGSAGSIKHDTKDATDAIDTVTRMVLTVLTSNDVITGICGVTEPEIKFLMVLYLNRNTFTSHDTLARETGESIRSKSVSLMALSLEKRNYIHREPGYTTNTNHKKRNFMIATKGIDAVMNYIKYIQKEIFK